jgi:hypothetical protein
MLFCAKLKHVHQGHSPTTAPLSCLNTGGVFSLRDLLLSHVIQGYLWSLDLERRSYYSDLSGLDSLSAVRETGLHKLLLLLTFSRKRESTNYS